MYKQKPAKDCDMPAPELALNVLVLNASLKHAGELSNTEELAKLVLDTMAPHNISSEIIRVTHHKGKFWPKRRTR